MWANVLLFLYCGLIVVASLTGGFLPRLMRLSHRGMQLLMSGVGGFMLCVAVLHMLPHAIGELRNADRAMVAALAGLLTMFLLIRVFHVHAHEHGDPNLLAEDHTDCGHDHDHHHAHTHHEHSHGHAHRQGPATHQYSWVGLAIGLALHTLIDGLALGAAVSAERGHVEGWELLALGPFLAICLHKPLDALSITSVMAAGKWSNSAVVVANVLFAVMCPLGALAFVFGVERYLEQQHLVVGLALAFAAGVFLCISLADLLPEVSFHSHDRIPLTTALLLGVALAWATGFLEAGH
jgi:zinc and cadmium transporter